MRCLMQCMVILMIFLCSNYAFANKMVFLHEMQEIYGSGAYITSNNVFDINGKKYKGEKLILEPHYVAYVEVQLNKEYETFTGWIIPVNQEQKKNRIYVDIFMDGKKYERIDNLFTEKNRRHKFKFNVLNVNTLKIVAHLPETSKVSSYFSPSIAFYQANFSKHTHMNKEWVIVQNQGCIDDEVQNYICGKCNKVLDSKISAKALGHINSKNWIIDKKSTCSTYGSEIQKCSRCSAVINKRQVDKIPHIYDDKWIIDKQSSCIEEGIEHRICLACMKVEKRNIPLSEHYTSEWTLISGTVLNNPMVYEGTCDVCKKLLIKNDNSYKFIEIAIIYIVPLALGIMLIIYWRKGYRINLSKSGEDFTNKEIEDKIRKK